jgi:geranylgeranyl pyrophosphate synthase
MHQSAPQAAAASDGPSAERLKRVPESRHQRERIRGAAIVLTGSLDKSHPLPKHEIERHARAILAGLGLPEAYLGFTMVLLGSAFWRDQVAAIPIPRRLLLLPHCLRSAETCPALYNEVGLLCQDCGACRLSELRALGQELGYRVLIAEGSPIVMQLILSGQADAVLGVGCLNSLEKALDKILLAGLPAMAVPLFASTCRNTATDIDWVLEMIRTPFDGRAMQTRTQVHLLRAAEAMFEPNELERLAPRWRGGPAPGSLNGDGLETLDPLAATETIAYDFLTRGGKHFRPFITLAAYDAMSGGHGCGPDGARQVACFPDAVRRVALAIELFHKASLVHDDIEDDDPFRYGVPTLHRRYGTPMAINVGDYLIGLGYRLVSGQRNEIGAAAVADIVAELGEAHLRLCEGQGAELAWREGRSKRITPLEALRIYALKTAPAFEAALYAGLRLAGAAQTRPDTAGKFARHLGVAFQILNDLEDWEDNHSNKRTTGTDVLGGRPTVLWALALEALDDAGRRELESLVAAGARDWTVLHRVRSLYRKSGAFDRGHALVAKHAARAREVADASEPGELKRLLHYFVDTILRV